ncbi:MAG: proprotein convertase P-domain-containing protein, partial [Acidobacteriota bacterium]
GNSLPGDDPLTLSQLETFARDFLDRHQALLGEWSGKIELDEQASGRRRNGVWQLVFRQTVDGVRVENARFDFHVNGGNLVAFGTSRWGRLTTDGRPGISHEQARARIEAYIGYDGSVEHVEESPPELTLLAVDPRRGDSPEAWNGSRGEGIAHTLVWRLSFRVPGEIALWTGEVDAHTGEIVAFYDAAHYASVRGGVFPISADGDCAGGGCDFPLPLPFADYTEDGQSELTTDDFGAFQCVNSGSSFETNLSGPYVNIDETCGPVSEVGICSDPLDLGLKAGENCEVAPGRSAGNTAAARTAFYQVNRAAQAARAYLPENSWLNSPVTTNTNVNNTCNASWGGEINMFRAGNGCGNTGENQGVLVHEWGHGFDQNDGGGYDNTSEAYADVVSIFWSRDGCIGPGFFVDGRTCSGYGDTCQSCTGVRDHDYARRQSGSPATPAVFVDPRCGSGGGPCGRETHCEAYPIGEAIFDLAVNDLPAMGLDPATAWQHAEKLWYETRTGSGGEIYTCSLPNSDSCSSSSWYQQMRVADDDDGNLDNGTPHAAALFAAFDRHGIACGAAEDPTNQNSSNCPELSAPVLSATAVGTGVELNWAEIANAASYTVLRGDLGCDRQQVIIGSAEAPATSFFDDSVDEDFIAYYRVRPNAANAACSGAVSNCVAIPESAKLANTKHRIVDTGALGNASGRLDPGETIQLPASLYNYGVADATLVSGSLRPLQPDMVRILDDAAVWPDLPQSQEQESLDPHFELTVLPAAQCGQTISVELDYGAQDVPVNTSPIDLSMGVFDRDYLNDQDESIPHVTEEPVISTMVVDDIRTITELDVSISISIFRSTDLVVDLTSPSGTTVRLKNQTSGGTNTRYDRDRQPDGPGTMDDFVGEPLEGTWTLAVSDVVGGPTPNPGTLRSWTLHATVDLPFECTAFECGEPVPSAVPGLLVLSKAGEDLQLDWDQTPGASGYHVLADEAPTLSGPDLAGRTEAATELTLPGEAVGPPGVTFYDVRAVNSCNWEGP